VLYYGILLIDCCCDRWLSGAGASLVGQRAADSSAAQQRQYQSIADGGPGPRSATTDDVDVFINSESMRAKPPGGSDSKPNSSDYGSGSGSDIPGGYGSLKQSIERGDSGSNNIPRSISADPRAPVGGRISGRGKNKTGVIRIEIEDEIQDPRSSLGSGEQASHRLGQYRSDPAASGESSVSSSALNSGENQPTVVFKEPWAVKEMRIKKKSNVGHLLGWRLFPVIIKSGDDLRQEQVVSQLMFQVYFILQTRKVGSWLRPYGIIATSPDSGIIEAIPDTVSLDVLRRRVPAYTSLIDFYERFYGDRTTELFQAARDNFVKSLAGYSIVCYILQLKDRHNGNILLDNKGHIMHIDFGFVLGITPGGNMGFEKAPFKLTREMIELMGGTHSAVFHKYR
jgi:hypothetical protein